jgi:hypothetical protein
MIEAVESKLCHICGSPRDGLGGEFCSGGHLQPRTDSLLEIQQPGPLPDSMFPTLEPLRVAEANLKRIGEETVALRAELFPRPPFDPHPPVPTPAKDGWFYCDACEKPQPATGHECEVVVSCADGTKACAPGGACWFSGDLFTLAERVVLAESLLCGMAYEHGRRKVAKNGDIWAWCDRGTCVFCDAARAK